MRAMVLVAVAAMVLAGCAAVPEPPTNSTGAEPRHQGTPPAPPPPAIPPPPNGATLWIEPLAFNETRRTPFLIMTTGCGFCTGAGGFEPWTEHEAFMLWTDLRALRVDFRGHPSKSGFHVHENITFNATELEQALAQMDRGHGDVWVVRVWTGRGEGPNATTLSGNLERAWTTAGEPQPCSDCGGAHYRVQPGNTSTVWEQHVGYPLDADDPFLAFEQPVRELSEQLTVRGVMQGLAYAPPPVMDT